MKTGPSGALAQRFLDSKLTPLIVGAALLAGVRALLLTPGGEETQIPVPPTAGAAARRSVGLPERVEHVREKRRIDALSGV